MSMKNSIEKQYPKREKIISSRFTLDEYQTIQERIKTAGVTLSRFIRLAILNGKVVQRITPEDAGILRQLSGMANNLNQLTRKANAGGFSKAALELIGLKTRIIELINCLSDDWKDNHRKPI